MVAIKLNLTLINLVGKRELVIKIVNPISLGHILKEIGVPEEEVGIVIRNGRWSPLECTVEENDEIQLFPVLSGG